MTGGGNGGTTPMTMTMPPPTTDPMPPADTPLPPPPDSNAINSLTSAQRLLAINAVANTENDSITQSAQTQDSISAVANSAGLGFFVNNEGATVGIRVDNLNPDADWTGTNAPPLSTFSYIFDKTTGARKTNLAEYENGDFYAVTGFWYRDSDDFGVFVDGPPRTEPLPDTGSATYRGDIGGQAWTPINQISFIGDIELQASFNGDNNMVMGGGVNITFSGDTESSGYTLRDVIDSNDDGVFTGGSINCVALSCRSSSWSGRFVGNPVTNAADDADSDGWPAGFIGTFGFQGPVDVIGFFGAIHEDLCAATGTGDAAFCTKQP